MPITMQGEMIEFEGNGQTYSGYLSEAEGGGPGVIVIQEWWGLVDHIKNVADRFAAAGFTALAPDFFHGKVTTDPDDAATMMMALKMEEASAVVKRAIDALLARGSTTGDIVGVVGFCMGGQLALYAATVDDRIRACVDFYGVHPNVDPDYSKLVAPVLGLFAEHDEFVEESALAGLDATLAEHGKARFLHTFPGVKHAFFNDDRPEVYDERAAAQAWEMTLRFLREKIGGEERTFPV
ncbi:MAG: dienelactone hydrolase family protein [Fimbriimonadaceae bacterium]|nr:dienelactone hydrolase family protein [Fimbriimonadaceae bacterium]QYK55272.1 MAG: dienelactone hydrolase family protein [Fimbriimonadaceae bacterium]